MHDRLRNFKYAVGAALLTSLTLPAAVGHFRSLGSGAGTVFAKAAPDDQQDALVAKGRERFKAYKCGDCHGENGEGTPDGDAPDLTHSRKTAEEVSKFLAKPSADADAKGMPDVPVDSPDHAPLVAYVMSIRAK